MARRRDVLVGAASVGLYAAMPQQAAARENAMYGLIGKMTAQPGARDELIEILLDGVGGMPGCLSYVVARDPEDADAGAVALPARYEIRYRTHTLDLTRTG